jgi:hypothetical protein
MAGFETEDVLYLLPVVTLLNGMTPFLLAAAIGAPLFAAWVAVDYQRVVRRMSKRIGPGKDTDGNDYQTAR